MRLIDADAAKKDFGEHFGDVQDAVCAQQIIDRQPTIDLKDLQPHGRWAQKSQQAYWGASYACSCCGKRIGQKHAQMYKYCPICGAKMIEEVLDA